MKRFFTLLMLTVACLGLNAQDSYTLKENIPYVSSADTSAYRRERCKLDVYYPTQAKGFKTIVWFHGGALEGGNKEIREELKRQGFAVVAPNYRLFPRCRCPQYIEDAAAAVAWTFAHIKDLGGDPAQIYVGGHSAGGYLTLMLCLDKSYLEACGVDADAVKAYYPVSGQCATHYTIRKERKISYTLPIVDKYAPLNNARKLGTRLLLFTGDRRLEQMSRYEENLYLKSVLEGIGNAPVPLYEMPGFDHGTVLLPACKLIADDMKK
ncbi:alpha/beta hydrolase [Prevotella sp. kh1p2]|uniref:alpha/beta hydrolase n=1 Tax=Prevotella sp. kh1p2 TaxID=1761883 RepID=UPI0008D1C5AD|nr:alpha/beta hydrolase [Prevotella sp. kh1p2]SES68780.1 alpha/beta hydrolase fold [Prevotella sp. kh1p2]SNU10281.1 alpha/beta hydrolase fold [Prevotellaceae bacterium KH2P17]